MSFGTQLKALRESKGYTQKYIAERLDCKPTTISEYEKGTNKPNYDTFIKICKLFNRDANYFMQDELDNIVSPQPNPDDDALISKYRSLTTHDKEIVNYILNAEQVEEAPAKTIYRFPVYNQDAAAGVGQLGRDDGYDMEEFVVDNIPDNAVFAMRISGESMNHKDTNHLIHTGSIVLINPKFDESELEDRIVIANFKGEVICKRYVDQGSHILFQSDNDAFEKENRKSSDDPEYKVVGIVLGVIENGRFIKVK